MERNPLTVLPASTASGPLTATGAELVGNYAIRILFSDGHDTGLYSWLYLREIDPETVRAQKAQKIRQQNPQDGNTSTADQNGKAV
jgi:DUF971 family protein